MGAAPRAAHPLFAAGSSAPAEGGGGGGGGGANPRLAVFDGLLHVLDQQCGGAGDRAIAAAVRSGRPTSIQALTYHKRMMDGTPAGRRLQRDWQQQIILETRAVEASTARYRKDALSAIERGEAAAMPAARQLLIRWFKPLADAIREEQRKVGGWVGGVGGVCVWGGAGSAGGCLQLCPGSSPLSTRHTHTRTHPPCRSLSASPAWTAACTGPTCCCWTPSSWL